MACRRALTGQVEEDVPGSQGDNVLHISYFSSYMVAYHQGGKGGGSKMSCDRKFWCHHQSNDKVQHAHTTKGIVLSYFCSSSLTVLEQPWRFLRSWLLWDMSQLRVVGSCGRMLATSTKALLLAVWPAWPLNGEELSRL
eukprot:761415-Hanusia_phi.AAC.2